MVGRKGETEGCVCKLPRGLRYVCSSSLVRTKVPLPFPVSSLFYLPAFPNGWKPSRAPLGLGQTSELQPWSPSPVYTVAEVLSEPEQKIVCISQASHKDSAFKVESAVSLFDLWVHWQQEQLGSWPLIVSLVHSQGGQSGTGLWLWRGDWGNWK